MEDVKRVFDMQMHCCKGKGTDFCTLLHMGIGHRGIGHREPVGSSSNGSTSKIADDVWQMASHECYDILHSYQCMT